MIFVFLDGLANRFVLFGNLVGIVVVEAVPFVPQPDANRDGEAFAVGIAENRIETLDAPGADRVAADTGQQIEMALAADAVDEEWLAVAGELVAVARLDDFHCRRRVSFGRFRGLRRMQQRVLASGYHNQSEDGTSTDAANHGRTPIECSAWREGIA